MKKIFDFFLTKYGNGDEINTFNLPDFRGRHLEGASTTNAVGTHLEAGIPNITGKTGLFAGIDRYGTPIVEGALNYSNNASGGGWDRNNGNDHACITINATDGETKTDGTLKTANEHHVYGASNTVQPDSVCVNYIIKY